MGLYAVHAARGEEATFDLKVPAECATAATTKVEHQLARARRGYRIRQTVTREIRHEEAA